MTQGTTAFERWVERRRLASADTEELYLNPLDTRIGAKLTIDLLDWDQTEFEVVAIRVVTRQIGRKEFPFVDYRIRGWAEDGEEIFAALRYVPLDCPDRESGLTHQVFLLQLAGEHGYEPERAAILGKNPQAFSVILQDQEYNYQERVEGVELPYDCQTILIIDEDQNGKAERDEVQEGRMTYWDFWRSTREDDLSEAIDYLFVEVNPENGWTEYLQGGDINPAVVNKL